MTLAPASGVTLANLAEENHPLLPLPRSHRARRERALDAKPRSEQAAHFALGDRKGRAGGAPPHRKEARQEPAARLQDRAHRADVLRAPAGFDGAEARVLPDAVEGVPVVEADRGVAAAGEEAHVVAAPAARHRDAAGRERRVLHELDERRRRLANVPAVPSTRVQIGPEIRRAHTGHETPSKFSTARSAPAARSSVSVWAVLTPMARMPALRAACTPTTASSKTRQCSGATPRRRAASR